MVKQDLFDDQISRIGQSSATLWAIVTSAFQGFMADVTHYVLIDTDIDRRIHDGLEAYRALNVQSHQFQQLVCVWTLFWPP